MTARLEKLFFFTLALCPFAMGAVYALVNMSGGWARFIDGHDYAFYGMSQFAFEGLAYAAVLPIAWLVSVRFSAGTCSRRCLVRNLVVVFAASVALRLAFFLFRGNGTDVSGDALWAWERARGMPVSDNRHVLFPAWMNYALFMKAFVSVFGERLDLFQLMAVPWGGLGSAAVLLLTRELTRSERVSVFAGLLHALSPNAIVYLSASTTPEHVAAPLFCLSTWLFVKCLAVDCGWRRTSACAVLSGLMLGAGDAIKPFFPVFVMAAATAAVFAMFAGPAGGRRARCAKLLCALALLAAVRGAVCCCVTHASERSFGHVLSRADPVPHFLCVGLDRRGEGMIHLGAHSRDYIHARLGGMSTEDATRYVRGMLADDWRGHLGEIPSFLAKKTIWAWQDDGCGFYFLDRNLHRPVRSPSTEKWIARICRYGASFSLVYYFLLMSCAGVFAFRAAARPVREIPAGILMTGLVVMAFFGLMLVSESQGRYKCLVMPQITAFAASMFMTCRRRRDEGSARCAYNDRLCVVMPVYNERGAIGGVLDKWVGALDGLKADYVIRPYNDGSRDDSLAVMTAKAGELNRSRVKVDVRDKPNGGHGHTILTGYREAAADGFGWIFQIDSDDEMGPEKFGELWNRRNEFDFLVGIRDGRRQALPRKIVSFVSRLCVRLFYGKSVWDVNTPYRLMRTSAFADFYSAIPLATFAPNVILSGLAARNGLRALEIRVPQHDRMTGEVSIRKWKLLRCAAKSFLQTVAFSFGEEWNDPG